ncbi:hypothetical protein CAMRE0001_2200 [Campylobacter rectus RM3267]|uniref:Uncharacterized protein n=2 Tax=Campylobacter rectus TaxID=203 RepID=A0A6G5QKJ8_CAMRE|nr:hypothetical protein CAMRE0001_2200 [Campylobacter rectus RM3267]QCD46132.1 hypothetical protein CRECT_0441 [Campylobacter rectus]
MRGWPAIKFERDKARTGRRGSASLKAGYFKTRKSYAFSGKNFAKFIEHECNLLALLKQEARIFGAQKVFGKFEF